MRILVVEDEPAIADFLVHGLEREGYDVVHVADGPAGRDRALVGDVDLMVLDRMLPGCDGVEVLKALQASRPTLPVIMLTARGEIADRVEGLDAGACDYMPKPFSFEELAARIRLRLRRPGPSEATVLEVAGIRLDLVGRGVQHDGAAVNLSPTEFDLLAELMRRPGQVIAKQELVKSVWGYQHDPGTNIVEVYVGYLRRKLNAAGTPAPIETVRSVGYRLRAE